MRMKLFGIENRAKQLDVSALEVEVNDWLEQHPAIAIVDVRQSSNGGSMMNTKVFISVWYEDAA